MVERYMKVFDYDAPLMERSVCYRDTNGILYILDREKKVGYSVHSDYLLDTYAIRNGHYKIFCVNGNTGFKFESRIFYFIHLQNEENYERKESSSAR